MKRPVPPVWRSILYVPGNVPKFIDKAHERGADCVLVDLEDSVTVAEKPAARKALPETMQKVARKQLPSRRTPASDVTPPARYSQAQTFGWKE